MMRSTLMLRAAAGAFLTLVGFVSPVEGQGPNIPQLKELSLDELANLEVTSVSRRAERLAEAPASIFVITAEDIRRSGATSLAEVLRLAPNLHVARMDAAQYGVSARGFNNAVANKLLVLVDGRTIYTPLFSGVFWDQEDTFIDDIERIEVISGPGATLWGANAVNGVININTYSARDTQGTLVSLGGGNREQHAAVRVGGAFGEGGYARVYGKMSHLENMETAAGASLRDSRRWLQAGFRADWGEDGHGITVNGNAYDGRSEDRGSVAGFALGRVELSGVNLLARATRQLNDRSNMQFQMYFDHYQRREQVLFQPRANLLDLEVQHSLQLGRHRLLSGTGYRYGQDDVEDGILIGFRPTTRALDWGNVFAHGEVALTDQLDLSTGLKLERNDYTGWEYLPSARLAWKPRSEQLIWGAVSRAVRAPARLDRDVVTPNGIIAGGPDFQSELANVVEMGYRGQLSTNVTSSVTGFLHRWDQLRSGTALPVIIENRIEGPVYGVEAWTTWQPSDRWRLSGGASAFRKRLRLEAGSSDPVGTSNPQLANDPAYQWMARSSVNLTGTHELDVTVRRVASLPNPAVPAYTAANVRFGWRLRPDLAVSIKGEDLFDSDHSEFGTSVGRSELSRGVFARVTWSR
jgi:iron complex outermembrane receptor protein